MKRAKTVLLIGMALSLCCALTACSKPEKSEDAIKQDIEAQDFGYQVESYGLGAPEISITKRQTNKDQKDDKVWCELTASNDDIDYWADYELLYVLYNDGWELETCYQRASGYTIKSTPSQGLADSMVQTDAHGDIDFLISTKDNDSQYSFTYQEIDNESNEYFLQTNLVTVTCNFDPRSGWKASGLSRSASEVHINGDAMKGKWQGRVISDGWFGYSYTLDLEILSISDEKIKYRTGLHKGDTTDTFEVSDKIVEKEFQSNSYHMENTTEYRTVETVASSALYKYYLWVICNPDDVSSKKSSGIYFGGWNYTGDEVVKIG